MASYAPSQNNQTQAYVCNAPSGPLESKIIDLEPLKSNQVEVRIISCGVCFTDIDAMDGKHGHMCPLTDFAAGHEGIGIVTAKGSMVRSLDIGMRVGVGWNKSTCNSCKYCLNGKNNLCPKADFTIGGGNKGCFSEYVHLDENFAFPIPDKIHEKYAAPLLCAGITVYAPMIKHGIRGGDKVGVIGVGGLGHLALQFLRALGCEVYAISRTKSKEEQAKKLGAHHFVTTEELKDMKSTLDYMMVTTSGDNMDWQTIIDSLSPEGKIILMGISQNPIPVLSTSLIFGEKCICGSMVGSSAHTMEMLEFAALHDIRPQIEEFAFEDINEAVRRVREGSVRFRAVLMKEKDKN